MVFLGRKRALLLQITNATTDSKRRPRSISQHYNHWEWRSQPFNYQRIAPRSADSEIVGNGLTRATSGVVEVDSVLRHHDFDRCCAMSTLAADTCLWSLRN